MSDNIFEGLDEYLPLDDNIFKDKKPLDHRYLPDNLPHRKEQITAIDIGKSRLQPLQDTG